MIDTPDIIQISVSMTTSSLSTIPFNIIFLSRIIFLIFPLFFLNLFTLML